MGNRLAVTLILAVCTTLTLGLAGGQATKPTRRLPPIPSTRSIAPVDPPSTLRAENITDEEVRAVRKIIDERTPGIILRIGGVSDRCNCGERPDCAHQVAIIVSQEKRTRQVVLSKIKEGWQLSDGQEWLMRFENYQEKLRLLPGLPANQRAQRRSELDVEFEKLISERPTCPADEPPKKKT